MWNVKKRTNNFELCITADFKAPHSTNLRMASRKLLHQKGTIKSDLWMKQVWPRFATINRLWNDKNVQLTWIYSRLSTSRRHIATTYILHREQLPRQKRTIISALCMKQVWSRQYSLLFSMKLMMTQRRIQENNLQIWLSYDIVYVYFAKRRGLFEATKRYLL